MLQEELFPSVVITSHNYGRYLKRAIDSVILQDFAHFEVIVVDDGSTDETGAIAKQYGTKIKYIHQEQSGPFSAARAGVLLAEGSHIVFVDGDDRLCPAALKNLWAAQHEAPDAEIIFGRIRSVNEENGTAKFEEKVQLSSDPLNNFTRFCRGGIKAPIAGGLIKTSLLHKFDRDDADYPASMDLAILGLGLLGKCVQIGQCTLDVFDHAGRLRNDIGYIHRSDLRLVDLLFDQPNLPAQALRCRREFAGYIERERARAYYRAGWHSLSWRSGLRALTAYPASLKEVRYVRRFIVSFILALFRRDEGPVTRPPSHWLFGHQREFFKDPIAFSTGAISQYQTNVRLDLQRRTYLIIDVQDIRHVLLENAPNYQPGGIARYADVFRGALLGTRHPRHEPFRREVAGLFGNKTIDAYLAMSGEIIDRGFDDLPTGTQVDLFPIIRSMNAASAGQIVLGCGSSDIMRSLDELILKSHIYGSRALQSFVRPPSWFPTRSCRVQRRTRTQIDELFYELVREQEHQPTQSMLGLSLAAYKSDKSVSLQRIRDNVIAMYLAVCDPVSVATVLAIHELANRPQLQQKIREEANSLANSPRPSALDQAALKRHAVLNLFIDELLRLHPVEWLLTRDVDKSDRLPSGVLVRRGDQVMISLYALHRCADVYPDAESFNPDRFKKTNIKRSGHYLPFGAGAMACLGQSLARCIIARSILTLLAKKRICGSDTRIAISSPNCFSYNFVSPVEVEFQNLQ